MQNHWLSRHLRRTSDTVVCEDNHAPIHLNWWSLDESAEMPIVRKNFVEMQAMWSIYVTEIDMQGKHTMQGHWFNH